MLIDAMTVSLESTEIQVILIILMIVTTQWRINFLDKENKKIMKSEVYIIEKAKGKLKDQKYHYPVCPSCGKDYNKLVICSVCTKLICDTCITEHLDKEYKK
jgi:hypothetical protein